MDLSTQKLNDFPYMLLTGFICFMLVTAGSAFIPAIMLPGGYVACIGGTINLNSDTQHPYSGLTVISNNMTCTNGQLTYDIIVWSIIISFFIYFFAGSFVWWMVRFIKLKTN